MRANCIYVYGAYVHARQVHACQPGKFDRPLALQAFLACARHARQLRRCGAYAGQVC